MLFIIITRPYLNSNSVRITIRFALVHTRSLSHSLILVRLSFSFFGQLTKGYFVYIDVIYADQMLAPSVALVHQM